MVLKNNYVQMGMSCVQYKYRNSAILLLVIVTILADCN